MDLDTDEVYLGEINPRISGAGSMTNMTTCAFADMPVFLLHLLEHVYGPGDYLFKGAYYGMLVTRGRQQTTEGSSPIGAASGSTGSRPGSGHRGDSGAHHCGGTAARSACHVAGAPWRTGAPHRERLGGSHDPEL